MVDPILRVRGGEHRGRIAPRLPRRPRDGLSPARTNEATAGPSASRETLPASPWAPRAPRERRVSPAARVMVRAPSVPVGYAAGSHRQRARRASPGGAEPAAPGRTGRAGPEEPRLTDRREGRPMSPKQHRGEVTSGLLLDAALSVYVASGEQGLTVSAVTRPAGSACRG
ncbi:hypothetical protein GCM10010518_35220 [Kitasatospora cinereorecta]